MCVCGRRGCLDVFCSGRTWPERSYRRGARWAKELERRGQRLAFGLANLLRLFQTPLVIFNGLYDEYEHLVRPVLQAELEAELAGLGLPAPRVVFGEPVQLKTSIGAALRAAEAFLEGHLQRHLPGADNGRTGRKRAVGS